MLERLCNLLLDRGLVEGASSAPGWGAAVKSRILPLLQHPKLRHHARIIRNGFDRLENPIAALVAGEGNFGKSTLINALLGTGEEVAKTDCLPLTWHITRYLPGSRGPRWEVHYDTETGSAHHLEAIAQESHSSRIEVSNGVLQCSDPEGLIDILKHEEERLHSEQSGSAIWQVVQSVPQPNGTTPEWELIDSPGLAQMRFGSVSSQTIEDFYHHADIVLWLLAADKTNSAGTRSALTSMARYGKPIIGVINRKDLIPRADQDRALEDVRNRFGSLLQETVLISALEAFTAIQNGNEAMLAQSGLPQLQNSVARLTGSAGRQTKAISLYRTSQQAAKEAAQILRQEAEVLEGNVGLYQKNLETARSLKERGEQIVKQIVSSSSERIVGAAKKAMKRTFIPYGEKNTDLWNPTVVGDAIHEQQREIIFKINRSLEKELADIQDEIAVREYQVQSYKGDATVRSHELRTSLSNHLTTVQQEIHSYPVTPHGTFGGLIRKGGRWLRDKCEKLLGIEITPEERQRRQRAEREDELEAYILGLTQLESEVLDKLTEQANVAIQITIDSLTAEVQECFEREFDSQRQVLDTIATHRSSAEKAVVPPPVLFTITKMLKARKGSHPPQ